MRPSSEELLESLLPSIGELSGPETLRMLSERGLIDRRAAERVYVREEYCRMVRGGMLRSRATEEIADRLCCSFEKVRAIVYGA